MPSFSCHVYSLEVQHIVCLEHRAEGGERRLKVTKTWIVTCAVANQRRDTGLGRTFGAQKPIDDSFISDTIAFWG
jgi:hypothetical protein